MTDNMKNEIFNLEENHLIEIDSNQKYNIVGGGFAYDVGFFIGAAIEHYRYGDAALMIYVIQHYRPVH